MEITGQLVLALLSFMVLWTGSILGLASYIQKQFKEMREDFDRKHKENAERYEKVNGLVIRHETILSRPGGRHAR